ncbi:TetR/AcrR family transcriptional regulator [Microtetraspora fusca]|uniref:TetR/AcrR family transcriptional regulator n=1 Tax=Microtetraspora fusca TaxID=1997 RepID=UPI0008363CEE|nr:TetR/AcrR family transcriptional regulator [Microtetraspora fusca]
MGRPKNPTRRDELLEKCCDHLLEHGVSGVSLRPLAAEVGASPRTLLYHFGSREELIAEALRRCRARYLAVADALVRDATPVGGDIAGVLATLWTHSATPAARPFLLLFLDAYTCALRSSDGEGEILTELFGRWHDRITGELTAVGADPGPAASVASLAIAVHRGLLIEWLATGDSARLDAARAAALDMLGALASRALARGGPGA